jgi:hypothetical protein
MEFVCAVIEYFHVILNHYPVSAIVIQAIFISRSRARCLLFHFCYIIVHNCSLSQNESLMRINTSFASSGEINLPEQSLISHCEISKPLLLTSLSNIQIRDLKTDIILLPY